MVQANVGHRVMSITLPKVILWYLSTYDKCRRLDKSTAQTQHKHHHHDGVGATNPSGGVDLIVTRKERGDGGRKAH